LARRGHHGAFLTMLGASAVDMQVEIYWPYDDAYYQARIVSFNAAEHKHRVCYALDDDEESIRLYAHDVRILRCSAGDEGAAEEPAAAAAAAAAEEEEEEEGWGAAELTSPQPADKAALNRLLREATERNERHAAAVRSAEARVSALEQARSKTEADLQSARDRVTSLNARGEANKERVAAAQKAIARFEKEERKRAIQAAIQKSEERMARIRTEQERKTCELQEAEAERAALAAEAEAAGASPLTVPMDEDDS